MRLGPVTREHTAPKAHDDARYRLRRGAALVALEAKRRGLGRVGGEPFRAEHMADGHSERTLERWARSPRKKVIVSL